MNSFSQRLKFYAFGVLLGVLMVSVMFKGRSGCKTPGTIKREELQKQQLSIESTATCEMECKKVSQADVQELFIEGSINYDESKVHDKPYPIYALEGTLKSDREIRLILADKDSVTKLVSVIDLQNEKANCNCK